MAAQPTRPLSAGAGLELSSKHLLEGASGEPVLVMHGLLGNKMNWRSLFRAGPLAQLDRDVIVTDARNHGVSPHAPEMSYDAMVDDTLRLLDAHAIERVAAVEGCRVEPQRARPPQMLVGQLQGLGHARQRRPRFAGDERPVRRRERPLQSAR